MTTDTAIKLAQGTEAKFDLLVTRPKKYSQTEYPVWTLPTVLFYNNHEDMHRRPLKEIAKPSAKLGITADAQSEAHFDFWPVFAGLKFYLHKHITKTNSVPQVVPKDFGDANIHGRTLRAIKLAQIMRIIAEAVERPPLLDMVSRGLLDMFSEHTIPMWLTYGVQLHFDSQDILGGEYHEEYDLVRPRIESVYYLTHLLMLQQAIEKDREDPMMPKIAQYECYNPFKDAYNDMVSCACTKSIRNVH
jgi:hypothetical protein